MRGTMHGHGEFWPPAVSHRARCVRRGPAHSTCARIESEQLPPGDGSTGPGNSQVAAAAAVATGQFVIPSVTDTHRCAWDTLNEKIATVGSQGVLPRRCGDPGTSMYLHNALC